MDIPEAVAPWVVLGAALGIVLLGTAVLVAGRLHRRPRPDPERPAAGPRDDLPGFLEFPPGTVADDRTAGAGWASLLPTPPSLPEGPPGSGRSPVAVATAAGLALALLVGATAVAAVASRSEDRSGAAPRRVDGPGGVALELQFGGVVLEPRAVGVTATYPRVSVTSARGRAVAEVELPVYNCLTTEAPVDPVAAGCTPAPTEYARLTTPELTVDSGTDGAVRVTGRFPTSWRPNGSPQVPTGRAYTLELTAHPDTEAAPGTWVPATGTLRLGEDVASTTGGADDRLMVGG